MLIKKLHGRMFDVFVGNGFSQWTRVKKTHYGVSVVAGNRLPRHILHDVAHRLG